jgi:hypothetical protein
MTIEVLTSVVVDARCTRVGMASGDLHVAQRNASVKRRRDEGCPKHVRMD